LCTDFPRILAIGASIYGNRHAGEEATRKYAEACALHLRTVSLRDDVGDGPLSVADAEVGRHIGQAHLGNPIGKEAHIWKAAKDKRSRTYYWADAEYLRVTTLGAVGARLFPELVEACEAADQVRAHG
jgi:hypothetical protein